MVMSSLVLKANSDVRAWFGQYIKLNQHKVSVSVGIESVGIECECGNRECGD